MQFVTENRKLQWLSKRHYSGLSYQKGKAKLQIGGRKEDEKDSFYKMDINFYAVPPFGNISLEDAENCVDERLKLLLIFEDIKMSNTSSNYSEYTNYVKNKLDSVTSVNGDNFFKGSSGVGKEAIVHRRRDHISHFLLRLYFCRTEELRKKFIGLESEFLRFRLLSLGKSDGDKILKFINQYHFNFEAVDKRETDQLIRQKKLNFLFTVDLTLFKLPFEEALDVVSRRRAYLCNGNAYISSSDMISIIVYKFQLELAQSLASLSVRLSELDEERRLIPLIDKVYKMSVNKKRVVDMTSRSTGFVTPDMLDDLSKQSFPPCMQHIHETLRKNHHLKHFGRLHYGLFLKNIGLSLEDALNFFREEFIQKITPERFQRDYAYNIRYNYGKEGKKVNLSAYSCAKIISGCAPTPGETHGCPFRHFDTENLRNLLKQYGTGQNEIDEIVSIVGEKNYTKACSKYFEVKHRQPLQNDEFIYHPNQFYKESRRVMISGPAQVADMEEDMVCENGDKIDSVLAQGDNIDSVLAQGDNIDSKVTQEDNTDTMAKTNLNSINQTK